MCVRLGTRGPLIILKQTHRQCAKPMRGAMREEVGEMVKLCHARVFSRPAPLDASVSGPKRFQKRVDLRRRSTAEEVSCGSVLANAHIPSPLNFPLGSGPDVPRVQPRCRDSFTPSSFLFEQECAMPPVQACPFTLVGRSSRSSRVHRCWWETIHPVHDASKPNQHNRGKASCPIPSPVIPLSSTLCMPLCRTKTV